MKADGSIGVILRDSSVWAFSVASSGSVFAVKSFLLPVAASSDSLTFTNMEYGVIGATAWGGSIATIAGDAVTLEAIWGVA